MLTKLFALIVLLGLFTACSESTNFSKGRSIYNKQCQSCHMEDGSGLGTYIPNLRNQEVDFYFLTCTIKKGRGEKNLVMPAFELSPVEYTNLINYLNEKFGSKKVYIPKDFDNLNKMCN